MLRNALTAHPDITKDLQRAGDR